MIPQNFLSFFVFSSFSFICTHLLQTFISFFNIFILLCHFCKILSVLSAHKSHPLDDPSFILTFRWQLFQFQNMNLQQVRQHFSSLFITEHSRMITSGIIFKEIKVQNSNMNARFNSIISIPCFHLIRYHL